MGKTIIRPVVAHSVRRNPGFSKSRYVGGSICLTLGECGHESHRKLSQGLPTSGRVRCQECERLRNGARPVIGGGGSPRVRHGWDDETQLPTLTELDKPAALPVTDSAC
jgi:hypothetical protein